jgi:hypothetical protein
MTKQTNTMKYGTALMSVGLLLPTTASAATVVLADAAADYVAAAGSPTTALTTLPAGWSYFVSSAANGGTEVALTAGAAGNAGEQGFTSGGNAGTAAVLGTNTNGGDYELFSNGDANGGVVGTDLLLHPSDTAATDFVIVRYTISVADASSILAGSGSISGSFRDLIVGGGAAAQSVTVDIYQNSTSLFSTAGGTAAQGTQGILTAADGTFNLTGLTLTAGDTIDFAVGINGHFGADETALSAQISGESIPEPSSALLASLSALGLLIRRRR